MSKQLIVVIVLLVGACSLGGGQQLGEKAQAIEKGPWLFTEPEDVKRSYDAEDCDRENAKDPYCTDVLPLADTTFRTRCDEKACVTGESYPDQSPTELWVECRTYPYGSGSCEECELQGPTDRGELVRLRCTGCDAGIGPDWVSFACERVE